MRTVIAVIVAGLVATMIDNFAAWRLFGEDFQTLAQTWGRYAIAVGGAALLPFIFGAFGTILGCLVAYLVLAGGTAFLAIAAFGDLAPPYVVLVSTSIYAVTAIFVYLTIANGGPPTTRAEDG